MFLWRWEGNILVRGIKDSKFDMFWLGCLGICLSCYTVTNQHKHTSSNLHYICTQLCHVLSAWSIYGICGYCGYVFYLYVFIYLFTWHLMYLQYPNLAWFCARHISTQSRVLIHDLSDLMFEDVFIVTIGCAPRLANQLMFRLTVYIFNIQEWNWWYGDVFSLHAFWFPKYMNILPDCCEIWGQLLALAFVGSTLLLVTWLDSSTGSCRVRNLQALPSPGQYQRSGEMRRLLWPSLSLALQL